MLDIERTERRARNAVVWGAGTAFGFSTLTAIWGALAPFGVEVRQGPISLYVAYVLAAMAMAGIFAVIFGMLEMFIASWRERRPLH